MMIVQSLLAALVLVPQPVELVELPGVCCRLSTRRLAAWDGSADDLIRKVVNGDEWHGVKFADCKFHAK